jgi:hypothetical protein
MIWWLKYCWDYNNGSAECLWTDIETYVWKRKLFDMLVLLAFRFFVRFAKSPTSSALNLVGEYYIVFTDVVKTITVSPAFSTSMRR